MKKKHFLIQTVFDGETEVFHTTAKDIKQAIEKLEEASPEYNASQYITLALESETPITAWEKDDYLPKTIPQRRTLLTGEHP